MSLDDISDHRLLTNSELADVVLWLRNAQGWTQDTLAEIAGVTVRTVQRVESGDPSSADTRRALGRAFEFEDIDLFNKPFAIPNIERFKEEQARIEREFTTVAVEPVNSGRSFRELAEMVEAYQYNQMGELSLEAERVFAELQEFFGEYGDSYELYTPTQKLEVNAQFQGMIDALVKEGLGLTAGIRKVRFGHELDPSMRLVLGYVLVGPRDRLPTTIRVPKRGQLTSS